MKTFIDPLARVESKSIGESCSIWAYVHILPQAKIGNNCKIGENTYIENQVEIGDNVTIKNNVCVWDGVTLGNKVFVGPSVVFTNDLTPRAGVEFTADMLVKTHINDGASLGGGAVIVCGHTIGRFSFIGAGSVVTRDVYPHERVFGNPARHQGFVCECGQPLKESDGIWICGCGQQYSDLKKGK